VTRKPYTFGPAGVNLHVASANASSLFSDDGAKHSELPGAPWFSLANYSSLNDWTAADWVAAIGCRLVVQRTLKFSPDTWTIFDHWRRIPADPIRTWGVEYGEANLRRGEAPSPRGPIEEFPMRDFTAMEDAGALHEELEQLAHRVGQDLRMLAVDAAALDEDLIEAFKVWLKTQRQKGEPAKLSPAQLANWKKARAICWVDIHLFQAATKRKLSRSDVAQALFPDRPDPLKALESAEKYGRRLLDEVYYDRLRARLAAISTG
jgi:hypothetical protein